MPRPRFQRAASEKREALLDAATKEFAAHGYDDASVNRILLAAGFSKGSFYYYFDDKADLAAAILEREGARYHSLLGELPAPRTAEEFWAAGSDLLQRSAARLRQEPHTTTDAMMRLGTALSRHPELLERISGAALTNTLAKLATFWKLGQDVGAVRTDMSVESLLSLLQDMKLTLIRLVLPSDRAASVSEIEAFARLHLDLVRRVSEKKADLVANDSEQR